MSEKPAEEVPREAKAGDAVKVSFKSTGFSLKKQVKNPLIKRQPQVHGKSLFNDEETESSTKQAQLVTGFDQSSGAILHASEVKVEEKKEYVIPAVPNKDWRNEVLNQHAPIKTIKESNENGDDNATLTFGLNVPTRDESTENLLLSKPIYSKAESDDEEMIEPISEQEAYNRDLAARPDAPDLDAYSRMPVEEFGAALLRGMGWKGDPKDTSNEEDIDQVIRRPALLGLGAKEVKDDPSIDKKLGAWGLESARTGGNNKKQERSYVPLVKVSKSTGKVIEEPSEKEKPRDSSSRKEDEDSQSSRGEKYSDKSERRSDSYSDRRSDRYSERSERTLDRPDRSRNSDRRSDRYSDRSDRPSDRHSDRYSDKYRSSDSRHRSSGSSRHRDSERYRESSSRKEHSSSSSRKRYYDESTHASERDRQKHSRPSY